MALIFAWDLLITLDTPNERHRATLFDVYLHFRNLDSLVALRARLIQLGARFLMLPELE